MAKASKSEKAATGGKGGAKQALIDGLNEDLAAEYQAVISYLLYSQQVHGAPRLELATFMESEIADELEHAKYLAHKIIAMGGTPTTKPAPIELPKNNKGMLEAALKSEKETIGRYSKRIQQAEAAGELALKVDLEEIVAEETRHMEDLQRMLHGWKD